jgi:hypothetical protein
MYGKTFLQQIQITGKKSKKIFKNTAISHVHQSTCPTLLYVKIAQEGNHNKLY